MQEPFKLKERNPDATPEERIRHQLESVEFGIASVAMSGLEVPEWGKAKMRELASKGLVGSPEWEAFFDEIVANANKESNKESSTRRTFDGYSDGLE